LAFCSSLSTGASGSPPNWDADDDLAADRQHCVVHPLKNRPANLPKAQPYRLRLVYARGAAARQLASRAAPRARLTPALDPNIARQREVVDAFLAASRAGDFEALVAGLDLEVVFRIDGGGIGPEARPPIIGAPAAAGKAARPRRALCAAGQARDRQRHGRADHPGRSRAARRHRVHRSPAGRSPRSI
jgi:hypothetical protein